MKRPQLVHFLAMATEDFITIRASITLRKEHLARLKNATYSTPSFPIQGLRLLNARIFQLKIVGLDSYHKNTFESEYESDSFGNFNFKIAKTEERKKIKILQLYETKTIPGIDLYLGTYLLQDISSPKKIIISDMDKTLIDTRWSNPKDLYHSLTRPLSYFPTVKESMEILHRYTQNGYHPFIVSASPHFYEDSIRDWLYQNQIYTAAIFLKDYRQIFSLIEGNLYPKDIRIHGLYKINHLLTILLMTGIPDQLVLIGDNFESDPLIYLTLVAILRDNLDPWHIWNAVKKQAQFKLTNKQDSELLNKMYQLKTLISERKKRFLTKHQTNIKIYIRRASDENDINIPLDFLSTEKSLIQLYDGQK